MIDGLRNYLPTAMLQNFAEESNMSARKMASCPSFRIYKKAYKNFITQMRVKKMRLESGVYVKKGNLRPGFRRQNY